nr:hypothetical protein [Actinomycetota bacterium]
MTTAHAAINPADVRALRPVEGDELAAVVRELRLAGDPDARVGVPDEVWEARPELAHVRQAAHARTLSADAVLGVVLARVALLTPPTVRLPAIVAGEATLDLAVGIVASPGSGKTASMACGRELIPTARVDVVDGLPIGSGEGLVDAFLGAPEDWTDDDGRRRRRRPQVVTAVLATLDEGQALVELGGRRGSTLLTTMRSGWSGATLGAANASADTHRVVPSGRYRLVVVIAWQPEHAAAIIDDTAGGTPQRVVWVNGLDPTVPDDPPAWPGPLDWSPPPTIGNGIVMHVDHEVADGIRAAQRARVRGEAVSDAEAHDSLSRLK